MGMDKLDVPLDPVSQERLDEMLEELRDYPAERELLLEILDYWPS